MNTVFLYAGQGSQRVGMGKDFYETYETYRRFVDSFAEEKESLGVDVKTLMQEGPLEALSRTENTQVCMAVFAAGVTLLLKEYGITPSAACGLSLGEYGALFAAGVFSPETYVRLTAFRGRAMMASARGYLCSMSAVLGLDGETIRKTCESYDGGDFVTVANYNCPGQTVICGDEYAVAEVEERLKKQGARRCVRLNVSGPFHTKYMQPAGEALRKRFAEMTFLPPKIPVALNVTGRFAGEGEDLKERLVEQVQSSVFLEQDLRTLLEAGYRDFIEIGPGNTMAGFLKKTARALGVKVRVKSIDTVENFRTVLDTCGQETAER